VFVFTDLSRLVMDCLLSSTYPEVDVSVALICSIVVFIEDMSAVLDETLVEISLIEVFRACSSLLFC